jgi:uncharacterized protein YlzI (FlbEa/FlbD family)
MLLELTSLDNLPVFINPFLVESVTQLPGHTIITMSSGEHVLVKEDASEVHMEMVDLVSAMQGNPDAGSMH